MVDDPTPQHHGARASIISFARAFVRHTVNITGSVLILLVGVAIVAYAYFSQIEPTTPSIDDVLAVRGAQPSVLVSASGEHLATYSRGYQEEVHLDQISPHVVEALLSTEDHRFYEHPGIDLKRTVSAVYHTLRGDAQGGSTITQQLARNLFPEEIGRDRSVDRKLREMITALKLEKAYSKDQILELYLNTVPFLYNVIGIEMAARTYYDKSAADLNVLESATLIGMLKGTSYYNPILAPGRAQKRRNVVLGQMVKHGHLSAEEFDAMKEQPLQVKLYRQPDPLGSAPHFAAYVRRFLIDWAEKNDYNIYTDGLVVESTIDDKLQDAATQAVERETEVLQNIADVEWASSSKRVASNSPTAYAGLRKKVEPFKQFWKERADLVDSFVRESPEFRKAVAAGQKEDAVIAKLKGNSKFMARLRNAKTRLEAGFLAMDPASGEIKAWVGSRDFDVDQFDHVAQAERQPGSTFKPMVYGAALELGLRPDRVYQDGPVEIRSPDGSIWRPTDMTPASGRFVTMRDGLVYSRNTITAQVMQEAGLPNIINLARAAGIKQSKLDAVPSLALGTSPVTLLEMVSSYSTIAQIGEYRRPVFIKRIKDREGNVVAEFGTESQRVMTEDTAVELIDMMRGVVKRGTGSMVSTRFNLVADLAGKTGTTQNNTDGWFILMHPNLVAGAWVGFNDSRITMRSDYWGQGGHNAALLVGDFFRDTLKAKLIDTKAKFPQPKRPAPVLVQAPPQWTAPDDTPDNPANLPPGYGVVTTRDGSTTLVIGPNGIQSVRRRDEPAGNGDSLGGFLRGLAGGGNGTAGVSSGTSSGGTAMSGGDSVFSDPNH
ncbi:penicillin-binding protein 1A [Noviherbaspirillum galbum]|uniref:Penicillin-binding protein n=1 Tax=Noviherbaspirillum galbum TaxID=2709383 RepID=A0A6B3SVY1_9BURK|nr:transglycosylase domain-containing protein [Noviherbaspirillum galbum]NEX63555.1 penicillin-binding protein [Noviherbaspirillum galbum]